MDIENNIVIEKQVTILHTPFHSFLRGKHGCIVMIVLEDIFLCIYINKCLCFHAFIVCFFLCTKRII